ncbi:ArsR/SmtB family transcription factor [Nonomuraea coxensis]|uniref:ArsR/SmtB family transcription factor n=1 Tax=Nonomuraea coxensis TaxID=404386 RepID=UPI00039FD6BC|nr:winged helix-turn-helix domain-containing protein [Nonomuraea coxensis]
MLNIRFTAADLRRITLAPGPNDVMETVLSVRPQSGPWRSRRRINGRQSAQAGVLAELVRAEGFLPDFLVQPDCHDLASGIERIGQTPDAQLFADLSLVAGSSGTSRWFRQLAEGAAGARQTLMNDLRTCSTASLAPMMPRIRTAAAADRSLRAETLLRGGIDALLATLNVRWHWDPPTLRIPSRYTYEVELCGRGLLLIPSYYAVTPVLTYRPGDSTVLMYPMHRGDAPVTAADTLGPLLGRTRAAVLAALRDPATTTALAQRVGISLASVSGHTTVLRNAGLISTTRIGGAVLHALTPLGTALVEGDPAAR